jgi:hypothetical protein
MEKQRLTQAEQAMLLWPMLALAARNQQILSYAGVAGLTGIAQQGLGEALNLIHQYCKQRGYPVLNCLVVSREMGLPGEGFPEKTDPVPIFAEQAKVFVFDWSGHDKPRPQDFDSQK